MFVNRYTWKWAQVWTFRRTSMGNLPHLATIFHPFAFTVSSVPCFWMLLMLFPVYGAHSEYQPHGINNTWSIWKKKKELVHIFTGILAESNTKWISRIHQVSHPNIILSSTVLSLTPVLWQPLFLTICVSESDLISYLPMRILNQCRDIFNCIHLFFC